MRFVHELTLERATAGAVDDYNQPTNTWAAIATVPGLVQPKSVDELNQANQGGPVVGDHSIFLPANTDIEEADRLVWNGERYEIDGLERRQYGKLRHIKVNARKVTPQ